MKSNILFGKKYEKEQYEKVIKACALKEVSNDLWVAFIWISNNDSVDLNYKVCQKFFFKKWKDFLNVAEFLKLVFWDFMQAYLHMLSF